MQLGEAKQVGALEDERVGIGDVQPTLHDRGADEDVELLLPEAHDEPLEEMLVHLAVGDLDARLWYELAQPRRRLLDGLDPIVDVEDLSLAEQLAPDRRRYLLVVVGADEGQHRVAFLRRRRDGGHLPDTGDGHFERARDRRRRHGQDIDRCPQGFEVFLVLYPEALLFVHDHETEVLERDARPQQPMRTDHDVDRAVGEPTNDLVRLLVGLEPRQRPDHDRKVCVPLTEGRDVLLDEQSRGYENSDLLAVLHRFERGAYRDLSLAIANIATDQSVHRIGLSHIRLDLFDGGELIRCLHVWEGVLQLA